MKSFLLLSLFYGLFLLNCKEQKQEDQTKVDTTSHFDFSKFKKGIDVSHFQGRINWKDVKKEKIDFAFIKATDGYFFKDKYFLYNWQETKKMGIRRGAYHFFRNCLKGKKQAENFIKLVPVDKESLPPVIDLELFRNCKEDIEKEKLINEIQTFLDTIESHYQKTPIIYYQYEFYLKYMMGEFKKYPLWVSDIYHSDKPYVFEERNWSYWQYNAKGLVKGIQGNVDLNYGK
jgi:lysozyme